MKRTYPSDKSGFKHSSQPGWHSTTPNKLLAAHRAGQPDASPVVRMLPRAPQPPGLSTDAHSWLACIPPRYQPLATARRHPHIVNRLCELWGQHSVLTTYLQELMLSPRPQRDGFSFEVLTELSDLQTLAEEGHRSRKG